MEGGDSSGAFIPSEITSQIGDAIEQAQEAITNVITENFDKLLLIVGTVVGISLCLWAIRIVKRFMSSR